MSNTDLYYSTEIKNESDYGATLTILDVQSLCYSADRHYRRLSPYDEKYDDYNDFRRCQTASNKKTRILYGLSSVQDSSFLFAVFNEKQLRMQRHPNSFLKNGKEYKQRS